MQITSPYFASDKQTQQLNIILYFEINRVIEGKLDTVKTFYALPITSLEGLKADITALPELCSLHRL